MESQVISNFQKCQIHTPYEIIQGYWDLLRTHRPALDKVIDMGAGDGRFSLYGQYKKYDGIEIEPDWGQNSNFPRNAKLHHGCVFNYKGLNYDACIGNPPYVRHHEISNEWRQKVLAKIEDSLTITLSEQSNLFVYFMCLGIIKTKSDGMLALIIPYEWVSRPSMKALRDYIKQKQWGVHIYRFSENIFDGVLTTASITIINKAEKASKWKYYNIDKQFNYKARRRRTGTNSKVLPYEERGDIWALRGLSPGTQKVFTLNEGERIHFGLSEDDVVPCVTSLREVPHSLELLDRNSFSKHYIKKGLKCWLIRSDIPWDEMSKNLQNYLSHIPEDQINTATCKKRVVWYQYQPHPAPKILYGSGFTEYGPKFLINRIKARAIGSAHGVHSKTRIKQNDLLAYLQSINFERQVVAHSGALKKVEVKQMNSILNAFIK